MRIIRDSLFIDPADRVAAAAIGNFDGVHLGHQAVIGLTRDLAAGIGAPAERRATRHRRATRS